MSKSLILDNQLGEIRLETFGQDITLRGGPEDANAAGGGVKILATQGSGTGGGADIEITAGATGDSATVGGGGLTFYSGNARGSSGAGGEILIKAGWGPGGGPVSLVGGSGNGFAGGIASLIGGRSWKNVGGAIMVAGGRGSTGGGAVTVRGGSTAGAATGGPGGDLAIRGGLSDQNGGDVAITGGDFDTNGAANDGGDVLVRSGRRSALSEGSGEARVFLEKATGEPGIAGAIGGKVDIYAGDGRTTAGTITIQAGAGGSAAGTAGEVNVNAGASTNKVGGAVNLLGGASDTDVGGAINITSGVGGSDNDGGQVILTTGAGSGTGDGGKFHIITGAGGENGGSSGWIDIDTANGVWGTASTPPQSGGRMDVDLGNGGWNEFSTTSDNATDAETGGRLNFDTGDGGWFRGDSSSVHVVGSGTQGAPGTFVIVGADHTGIYTPLIGSKILYKDDSTNDGAHKLYTVQGAVFGGGNTTVTVVEAIGNGTASFDGNLYYNLGTGSGGTGGRYEVDLGNGGRAEYSIGGAGEAGRFYFTAGDGGSAENKAFSTVGGRFEFHAGNGGRGKEGGWVIIRAGRGGEDGGDGGRIDINTREGYGSGDGGDVNIWTGDAGSGDGSVGVSRPGHINFETGNRVKGGSPDYTVDHGEIQIEGDSTDANYSTGIRYFDQTNTNFIKIGVPPTDVFGADVNFFVPFNPGSGGQVLATDGAGNLGWSNPTSITASGGGQIQSDGSYAPEGGAGLGIGQTWTGSNLAGSTRFANINYTNSSTCPIAVAITFTTGDDTNSAIIVNGVEVSKWDVEDIGSPYLRTLYAIVPAGQSYMGYVRASTITRWTEMTTTGSCTSPGGLGVNQAWSGQARVLNTAYTNNSGYPIALSIKLGVANAATATLRVSNSGAPGAGDEVDQFNATTIGTNAGDNFVTLFGVVPNGGQYDVTTSGSVINAGWYELRGPTPINGGGLGVGQTWTADLGPSGTAARAANTAYENTDSCPRHIQIRTSGVGSTVVETGVSAGALTEVSRQDPGGVTVDNTAVVVTVPAGRFYRVTTANTVTTWKELQGGTCSAAALTKIIDADQDTFVRVAQSATGDEDAIEMRVGDNSGDYDVSNDIMSLSTAGVTISVPDSNGNNTNADGGSVTIEAGDGDSSGTGGAIFLQPGYGGSGAPAIPTGSGVPEPTELWFVDAQGTPQYVGFKAPDDISAASTGDGANTVWTLPEGDGNAGEVMVSDGSAVLGFGFTAKVQDADGDTKVDVEESADEDTVRIDLGDATTGYPANPDALVMDSSQLTIAFAAATGTDTAGATISFTAGNANGEADGGHINLTAGTGPSNFVNPETPGNVNITGGANDGNGSDDGSAGAVNIAGGAGGSYQGGYVNIDGGSSGIDGGYVNITGGEITVPDKNPGRVQITGSAASSVDVDGGPVIIEGGESGSAATAGRSGGSVRVKGGDSETSAIAGGGTVYIESGEARGLGQGGGNIELELEANQTINDPSLQGHVYIEGSGESEWPAELRFMQGTGQSPPGGINEFVSLRAPKESQTVDHSILVLRNTVVGNVTDTADGANATGFTFTKVLEGSGSQPEVTYINPLAPSALNSAGAADYWTFSDGTTSYYVWYNITPGTNSDPAPGGTGIQVDLAVPAEDTIAWTARKTQLAIDGAGGDMEGVTIPGVILTLPPTPGNSGQVLTTDGLNPATMSWASVGSGTLTFPLLANPNGTAGAPAYSFNGKPTVGMYSDAANTIGLSTDGDPRVVITNTAVTLKREGTTELELLFEDGADVGTVGFKAPDTITTPVVWALPVADGGTDGEVLATDSSGQLKFQKMEYIYSSAGSAATSHAISHNLNQQYVTYTIWDRLTNQRINNAATETATDANTLTLTFTVAQDVIVAIMGVPGLGVNT